jgi:hypothetical protein
MVSSWRWCTATAGASSTGERDGTPVRCCGKVQAGLPGHAVCGSVKAVNCVARVLLPEPGKPTSTARQHCAAAASWLAAMHPVPAPTEYMNFQWLDGVGDHSPQ